MIFVSVTVNENMSSSAKSSSQKLKKSSLYEAFKATETNMKTAGRPRKETPTNVESQKRKVGRPRKEISSKFESLKVNLDSDRFGSAIENQILDSGTVPGTTHLSNDFYRPFLIFYIIYSLLT